MPLKRARRSRRARALQVAVLALSGICLSVSASYLARRADDDRVRSVLEARAEWRARDLERKLAAAGRSAEALAIYLTAQGEVTAAQFHTFARLAHDPADADTALYWAPRVADADRPAFVAAARQNVDPAYEIQEIGPDETFVPAAVRTEYLPQLYEETFSRLPPTAAPRMVGFDLMARPERKKLIERARDTGQPMASALFPLLTGTTRVPGFVILWPVYVAALATPSVEDRRAAFRGVVTVRFRLDHLLPALAGVSPDIVDAIGISADADSTSAPSVVAFDLISKHISFSSHPLSSTPNSVTLQRNFTALGQTWTLHVSFFNGTVAALGSSAPWTWLLLGMLVTTVVIAFVWQWSARLNQAEVVAIETGDRFRRLFDEHPIGMALLTADHGRFVQVNAAFCRMLEYSAEQLLTRTLDDIAARDSVGMSLVNLGEDAGWNIVDKHYIGSSGRIVTARVRIMAMAPSSTGQPLVLGLVEDVTAQRKLEDTLRQAQKIEAVGQLTGGIAHDFNNLLGIIVGNLDLLQATLAPGAEAGELVEEALAATLRGADLTQRLLAFSRRQPLDPKRLALNEQITEISKLLTRTIGGRIHVSLDLAPDVWPITADATQLEACIINLATNARDAMPTGGMLIIATANRRLDEAYAAAHPEVKVGDYAMIEITDTGTGMPQAVLSQIFEPFFTTKEPSKGTGLGLSMVFGFVMQSNGHLTADSEPGEGATFRLYFPRADGSVDLIRPKPQAVMRRGHGETVLVVEDNQALRRVVVRQMRDLGYVVLEANSAAAALAMISREPVDLVFTDVVMPGDLDGFGLASRIMARWPSTKVLLTSGFPEAKFSGRSDRPSASARLLGKPYRTDDLARVVREVLEA
jgi:PAS domain S-box-containing protein